MKSRIWNSNSYSTSQLALVGALLLLLPLLAAMQYRLLEKVSEGERERMRASLQASANRFSLDFDQEIIRVYSAFLTAQVAEKSAEPAEKSGKGTLRRPDREAAAPGEEETGHQIELLNTAYQRWHETTAYPRLLAAVYLIGWRNDGTPELTRLDPERGRGERVEWPPAMSSLRTQLAQRETLLTPRRESGGPSTPSLLPALTLDDGQPGLIFQLIEVTPGSLNGPSTGPGGAVNGSGGQPGAGWGGPRGIALATIDRAYLEQEMLPALVRHHFVAGDRQHFDMAIALSGESERAVWRMEAGAARTSPPTWRFAESDLSVKLFSLRSDLLRQQLRRWRPSADQKPPAAGSLRLGTVGGRLIFADELPPLWDLHLRHYSGSLDMAVANARRTNVMISLAILFLLTASFVLMMVSSIRARRLAQEQMNFVAGVSHELRTPLAVIDSAGYNLSRGVVKRPEAMREYGEMIRAECRRLGEMVEQVLDFATFRSGRQIFDYHPLPLTEIIDEAVRASQPLLEESGFRIEQQLPEQAPGTPGGPAALPLVMADRQALIRALRNLLSNAMKYGGEDHWIGLRLSLSRRGRQEMVNLTISDHGRGIAREDLGHIFEPFYRSSDVRTAQIQGNGLGLSLVRNIVESHRGAISVESQVGRGTTFTISLPAVEGATEAELPYLLTEGAVRTP